MCITGYGSNKGDPVTGLPIQHQRHLRYRRCRQPGDIEIQEEGSFKERKHTDLIHTAIKDAVSAVDHIAGQSRF
jgi:hypothetical protein